MKIKNLSTRQKIAWVLHILFFLFIITQSAYAKLTQAPAEQELFASHGLDGWLFIIGLGELACAVFFLIPQTMRLGLVLYSAYFGGAIMFHMSRSEDFTFPAVFLILTWILASVREPNAVLPFSKFS